MLSTADFRIYEGIASNINFENILGIIYEGFLHSEKPAKLLEGVRSLGPDFLLILFLCPLVLL